MLSPLMEGETEIIAWGEGLSGLAIPNRINPVTAIAPPPPQIAEPAAISPGFCAASGVTMHALAAETPPMINNAKPAGPVPTLVERWSTGGGFCWLFGLAMVIVYR